MGIIPDRKNPKSWTVDQRRVLRSYRDQLVQRGIDVKLVMGVTEDGRQLWASVFWNDGTIIAHIYQDDTVWRMVSGVRERVARNLELLLGVRTEERIAA